MKRTRKNLEERNHCVKHTISLTFIFNSINIKNRQRQLSIQIYSVGKKNTGQIIKILGVVLTL